MHRLSELVQDVVRRIDDVVDRTRSHRCESLHEPLRTRADRHVADDDAHVTRREASILEMHHDAARIPGASKALGVGNHDVALTPMSGSAAGADPRDRRDLACEAKMLL